MVEWKARTRALEAGLGPSETDLLEALVEVETPEAAAGTMVAWLRQVGCPRAAVLLCQRSDGPALLPEGPCRASVLASGGEWSEGVLDRLAESFPCLADGPGPGEAPVTGDRVLLGDPGHHLGWLVADPPPGDPEGRHQERLITGARRLASALRRALAVRRLQRSIEDAHQVQGRLIQAEKHAAIGRLAAGLAHEIGTPLNIISGRAELMLEEVGSDHPGVRQAVKTITGQIERISGLVRQLLDFAREHAPVQEVVDLEAVVRDVADLMQPTLLKHGIALVLAWEAGLPRVRANGHQLQQVLLNLLLNSQDAIQGDPGRDRKGRGEIRITGEREQRGWVRVRVWDNGQGILPSHLHKVCDPFFTTKPVGTGTGLGLAVVYGIVTEHGGTLDIQSRWGEETTVSFTLRAVPDDEVRGLGFPR